MGVVLLCGAVLGASVLAGGLLWLRSDSARLRLHEALVPRLEARLGRVELGEVWRPGLTHWELGPLTLLGPDDGGAPLLRAERIRVTPSWRGLFDGAPIRRVTLDRVDVDLGPRASRIRWLQEQLSPRNGGGRETKEGGKGRQRLPEVQLHEVTLHLGPALRFGPAVVRLLPPHDGARLGLEGRWGEAALTATVSASEGEGERELEVAWEGVPLAELSRLVRPGLLTKGHSSGQLRILGSHVDFRVEARDAHVAWHRLDAAPVGPLHVGLEGAATWSSAARAIELERGTLLVGARGEVRIPITAHLPLDAEAPFHLSAQLPPTRLQSLAHSLPAALAPHAELKGVDGPITAALKVSGSRSDRSGWEVEASLDLDAIRSAMRGRPTRLSGTFEHQPLVDEDARGRILRVGPANPFFVPGDEVPHVLMRAVLLSEDSFFHAHPGFDIPSLVRNLLQPKEGTLRGGSTLTQQLAKNLYLSREKTYARKLREAFLTVALEASLPKARLLEIYLNVIEWGPDVFGLGEAAWHYFGKDARALSTREALFLATIIPNPIRYHGYCSRGAISERWEERMGQLFDKMVANGELDPLGAAIARHQPLAFQHRARVDAFFEPLGLAGREGTEEGEDAEVQPSVPESWDVP
ncbi:MAG TPA: biosynthetic peptidoglycan transglycosylase [Myxococcaceae bacterium]|nr:biosynthetic peptidoglycan transglycosylase [Myxococcaceae bacterium]